MDSQIARLLSRAKSLAADFTQGHGTDCIDGAIVLDRKALALCRPDDPRRSFILDRLATHLSTRYNRLGETQDLDEAIVLNRQALEPQGHPERPGSLNNLALNLWTRHDLLGGRLDLDEAIVLVREALQLSPRGDVNRSKSLNNLAIFLSTRYKLLGGKQDLDETIVLNREALQLRPQGDPDRPASLNNLAVNLLARYRLLGAKKDLDEAVVFNRKALQLCPYDYPDRRLMSLHNLAANLLARYGRFGKKQDLDEAILHGQEALQLCLKGHPHQSALLDTLAACLSARSKLLASKQDLDEAIVLRREVLQLCPQGHPEWSTSLISLASNLHTRFTWLSDSEDKEELFSLYAELAHAPPIVSSSDLSAVRAWIRKAESFYHPSTLLAYETYLRLLAKHLASLPLLPQHMPVIRKATASFAVDAFSACLRNSNPARAVELLEQGRGVFWNQLTHLRSPLDDVVASGPAGKKFADKFTHLTSLIRDTLKSPGTDQHGQLCHLNLQLEKVVDSIRALPGLSQFLLPSSFADLQLAASEGPVIILNSSQYGRDAVVVLLDRDPVHIPLQITRESVLDLSREIQKLSEQAKRSDMTREFASFLCRLWDEVVSPIVDFLQTCIPIHSRIWWCPTAEFSVLPLHAAGPNRKGQLNLPHRYISSYTPTLGALVRARRASSCRPACSRKRFVAVGQANASGESQLLSVGSELANIGHRVDGLARFTQIEGPESSISRVAEVLGKNEWVHLACHGIADQTKPFESAFALRDGHFTIERIIRCELDDPEFAYLSACHTTVGDKNSPDEVIHLASAMQFIGFRSVIGTMWAVDDGETNKITSMFYSHMVDGAGRLDHTRAAYALNKTMRNVSVPLDQRILYIHLGA